MGTAVQRIEFLETLGRGGFGSVYLANVTRSDQFVQRLAVKLMSADLQGEDDLVARQRDEARLLAQLNHDHIVKVMDLTEIHGRPALIMEYVEGADCAALLETGPLSTRASLEIVKGTASALAAAWTTPCARTGKPLRVIHRDIKPSNLLISRHGGLKVLDFGVARAEFDREGKTSAVQFGTARFMSPEQWLFGGLSHAVDIYALGVSALEFITGGKTSRLPLDRAIYETTLGDRIAALALVEQQPAVAREIRKLLLDMLAFDPKARPAAEELHTRCADLLDHVKGSRLEQIARQRVPKLIDERRAYFSRDPMLSDFHPHPSIGDAEVENFPTVETETQVEPQSEDTLARDVESPPSPRGLWIALPLGLLMMLGVTAGTYFVLKEDSSKRHHSDRETRSDASESKSADESDRSVEVSNRVEDEAAFDEDVAMDGPVEDIESPPPPEAESREETPPTASTPPETTQIERSEPGAETVDVMLNSDPWGAQVTLDGKLLGTTPINRLSLKPGRYTLVFEMVGDRSEHEIHVVGGRANHFQWQWSTDRLITVKDPNP